MGRMIKVKAKAKNKVKKDVGKVLSAVGKGIKKGAKKVGKKIDTELKALGEANKQVFEAVKARRAKNKKMRKAKTRAEKEFIRTGRK